MLWIKRYGNRRYQKTVHGGRVSRFFHRAGVSGLFDTTYVKDRDTRMMGREIRGQGDDEKK